MLVVKKYPNRRLYDTAQSRYITLEDLADRIKSGADVLVQDVQSGADLTQATLTQIILESRGGARLLPVPLLVRLIRLGDEALAEFLGRYVSWALELYVQARAGARTLMPLNPLATAPFAATDALARLVLGASQWAGNGVGAPGAGAGGVPPMPVPEVPPSAAPPPPTPMELDANGFPPPPPPPPPPTTNDVADDVARLRREIEELKRSMGGGAGPARAAKRAAKPKKR
ncbi:MAG: polyhydroxyalkanoate synthesis regulator DNA-binding domain-containing protein [Deltaproteobacteria bacterium]|nr:polyhydroxyalkanoate synthesis regulator DNA-binding domain-containing protein [Deltaproteobacteria bacterium]